MNFSNTSTKALRRKIIRYHKNVEEISEIKIAENLKSTRESLIEIATKYQINTLRIC